MGSTTTVIRPRPLTLHHLAPGTSLREAAPFSALLDSLRPITKISSIPRQDARLATGSAVCEGAPRAFSDVLRTGDQVKCGARLQMVQAVVEEL